MKKWYQHLQKYYSVFRLPLFSSRNEMFYLGICSIFFYAQVPGPVDSIFFPQEYSKVCHLSLARTRLLFVVQKNTNHYEWLYTRFVLWALKVSYSNVGEGGVAVNCENHIFSLTPCISIWPSCLSVNLYFTPAFIVYLP